MESIRRKLIKNFLVIIIITIIIIDIFMMAFLRQYYYENTRKFLENQVDSSINFYNKYFSVYSLKENIFDNADAFWQNSEERIEILTMDGELIMDSEGIRDNSILKTPDIKKAMENNEGVWSGKVGYYKGNVMIVSKVIMSDDVKIGIIRIIHSLEDVDNTLKSVVIIFCALSVVVIILGVIISIIKAKDISDPIKKVTEIAEEMAKGNLDIRSSVNDNKEISKLSEILNFMASEVNTREKMKNQFISSVSHELRTPLTAIKGWVHTIQDDLNEKEIIKMGLEIIEDETDRLSNMVEELLDFSKIINGIVKLNKDNCDLEVFIEYIETLMKARAIKEDKTFIVKGEKNIGNAYFDVNKIKQVLINIIDNAFKFTNRGGQISLQCYKEKGNIVFLVKDNGVGISLEDLPKVKNKFYKGKNSNSQNGIGLSVCDELIKLHDGTMDIISEEEMGTEVIIKIPVK